jgi:hypothetical protein
LRRQDAGQSSVQLCHVKWLHEYRHLIVARIGRARIAADEQERHALPLERIGDLPDKLLVHLHVEQNGIDIRRRQKAQRLRHG